MTRTRRAASRSSTPTTSRTSPSGARRPRAAGRRCSTWAAPTGRVAIPLARDGHEVWALDRSEAMLAELGRRLEGEPPDVRARVHPVRGGLAEVADLRPAGRLPAGVRRDEHAPGAHRPRRPGRLPARRARAPRRGRRAGVRGRLPGPRRDRRPPWASSAPAATTATAPAAPCCCTTAGTTAGSRRRARWSSRCASRSTRAGEAAARAASAITACTSSGPDEIAALLAEAGLEPVEVAGDFDGEPLRPRAASVRSTAAGRPREPDPARLPPLPRRDEHLRRPGQHRGARAPPRLARPRLEVTESGLGEPVDPGAHDLYYLGRRPGPRPGRGRRGPPARQGRRAARGGRPTAPRRSASAAASSSPGTATPAPTARACRGSACWTSTPSPARRA